MTVLQKALALPLVAFIFFTLWYRGGIGSTSSEAEVIISLFLETFALFGVVGWFTYVIITPPKKDR